MSNHLENEILPNLGTNLLKSIKFVIVCEREGIWGWEEDLQGFCAEQHFYRFGKEKLFALIEVQFWNNFDFSWLLGKIQGLLQMDLRALFWQGGDPISTWNYAAVLFLVSQKINIFTWVENMTWRYFEMLLSCQQCWSHSPTCCCHPPPCWTPPHPPRRWSCRVPPASPHDELLLLPGSAWGHAIMTKIMSR